jgi:hypothetical protein
MGEMGSMIIHQSSKSSVLDLDEEPSRRQSSQSSFRIGTDDVLQLSSLYLLEENLRSSSVVSYRRQIRE